MNKRNILLIIMGVVLIIFFASTFITNLNLTTVATDSGFDTSYDGGGSSGGSSWGGSHNGSSSGDYYNFDSPEGTIILMFLISVIIVVIIFGFVEYFKKHGIKNLIKNKLFKPTLILVVLFIVSVCFPELDFILALIIMLILFVVVPFLVIKVIKKSYSNINVTPKTKQYLPNTEENRKVLEECYKIFVDIQTAWMKFDYDKLRELTTDELYNTYYNQLQSLVLKGQKNIMSDFELVNYELVDIQENNNVITSTVELEVKFFDYIIDNESKILRGNNKKRVCMLYELTYVYNEEAIEECPNCNAKISKEDNICSYCKTTIPSIRGKMKLSTKKCIRQR